MTCFTCCGCYTARRRTSRPLSTWSWWIWRSWHSSRLQTCSLRCERTSSSWKIQRKVCWTSILTIEASGREISTSLRENWYQESEIQRFWLLIRILNFSTLFSTPRVLRSLKAAESLTPDTNSHSFEFEISFPDASIVKIEGQQPPFGSYMMMKFPYTSINSS